MFDNLMYPESRFQDTVTSIFSDKQIQSVQIHLVYVFDPRIPLCRFCSWIFSLVALLLIVLLSLLKDGLSTNFPLLGVVVRRTPLDGNRFCPHVTKGNNNNMMINFMVYLF